ncbi:MAG: hypothetical protein ABL925_01400 [Methylococcales bacterium]
MKNTLIALITGIVINLCFTSWAYAHNGQHHNNSCFFTIGDSKLRLNGYYLNNRLAGKHFCRIYPSNGQIVLAVDMLDDGLEKAQLVLQLSSLSDWSQWPTQLFTKIAEQPARPIAAGLIALQHSIEQPGLYAFDVSLQDAGGNQQSQRLFLIAGIPVTQYLIYFTGILLLVIAYAWLKSLFIKPK